MQRQYSSENGIERDRKTGRQKSKSAGSSASGGVNLTRSKKKTTPVNKTKTRVVILEPNTKIPAKEQSVKKTQNDAGYLYTPKSRIEVDELQETLIRPISGTPLFSRTVKGDSNGPAIDIIKPVKVEPLLPHQSHSEEKKASFGSRVKAFFKGFFTPQVKKTEEVKVESVETPADTSLPVEPAMLETAPLDQVVGVVSNLEETKVLPKVGTTESKTPKKVPLFSTKPKVEETKELSFEDLVSSIPPKPDEKTVLLEELENGRYVPHQPDELVVNLKIKRKDHNSPQGLEFESDYSGQTRVIEEAIGLLNQQNIDLKDVIIEEASKAPTTTIYTEAGKTEINPQKKKTETKSKVKEEVDVNEKWIFASVPKDILLGGITLFNNLTKQLRANGKLKVESLMSILGALAGFSIQEAVREKMVHNMGLSEEAVFSIVETKNGEQFYFSDTIDQLLQKNKDSLWNLSASAAARLTGRVETNIDEVIRFNTRNLGSANFGIPRLPNRLKPSHIPIYYVEHMWSALRPGLERFTDDPLQWPLIFGVAIQRALILTASTLNPNISLKIILESAVPMTMAEVHPLNYRSKLNELENLDYEIFKLKQEIQSLRERLTHGSMPEERRQALMREYSRKTERYFEVSARRDTILINEGRRSIE